MMAIQDARSENSGDKMAYANQDVVLKESVHEGTGEVFDEGKDVNFRTVGWIWATMIFLKIMFATGVLSVPIALAALGAFPGAVNVIGWCAVNTYAAVLMGDFRNRHSGCHSVADMAQVVGGKVLREIIGGLFIITWVIVAGSGMVGAATALNALSTHALCTNWFLLMVTVVIIVLASIRTFDNLGWLTWAGFIATFVAVFIVVVGVTKLDRPVAAPQEGPYELGYVIIASPTFIEGINAVTTIFVASAGSTAFLPVISEMRDPKQYKKSLYVCMAIITASYLSFSMVVYRWCGTWVASPSLSSAGPLVKKIAYGIAFIGLLVTGALYVHIAAKYLFVRILRNSDHLQSNTWVHWSVWFSCTVGLGGVALAIAGGVPIFNFLLSLAASVGFAPLTVILPSYLYIYDYSEYRKGTVYKKIKYWGHWVLFLLGCFLSIGGLYAVISAIREAYTMGTIGSAFSCADNSGSVSS